MKFHPASQPPGQFARQPGSQATQSADKPATKFLKMLLFFMFFIIFEHFIVF